MSIRKYIRNEKGEGYIDTAVSVMILAFILILLCSLVTLTATVINVQSVANKLCDYACMMGTTNVDDYAARLIADSGMALSFAFTGTDAFDSQGHVQLGHVISCRVYYEYPLIGFGTIAGRVPITGSADGVSRVYWK